MQEKKEKLEKWLDDMIEVHSEIWKNRDFGNGISVGCIRKCINVDNLVRVAEILNTTITFEPPSPDSSVMFACVKYKGVELRELIWKS